ncbi:hypothetical protein [Streptomyces sp. MBT28]|uniref:hypothetical protein n=1 Tax=Streptomyces sp. MBT28 TaxID=1488357 RepID=UPI000619CB69|nr:hypothetical protein [Streptomyces sp. MBT28]
MNQMPGDIEENATVMRGREPVVQLVVPASVCHSLTRPIDYAVYIHFCLALEERARNWGAPAHTADDLWRRMAASGLSVTRDDVTSSLLRLQNVGLLQMGHGDVR